MIEINLLPEEKKIQSGKFSLNGIEVIRYVPVVIGALLAVHLILLIYCLGSYYSLAGLNKKWIALSPQIKILQDFKRENDSLSKDTGSIKKLFSERINWSQKLNALSQKLPFGVWFTELGVTGKSFSLKGSVVSLQKGELSLINKFIQNLKDDQAFIKDFTGLELSSVQSRDIAGVTVVDFTLLSALK